MILAAAAAALCGIAVLRACGARGGFAVAGGIAVGLGLSGTAWTAGLLSCGATGAGSDLVLLAVGLALLARERWWPGQRSEGVVHRGPKAPAPLIAVCALAACVVAALFVEHSIRYPEGGWDAVAIWNLRARALFGAPDRLADVFTPELAAQHPDYPLLLPGLIAHGWFAWGTRTQLVPILVSFLFAAAAVAALGSAVGARKGTLLGVSAALVLLGTPDFLTLAWNQYADLKLAVLVLIAVALATDRRMAGAGLLAGLGAYTKNEGLLWLGALLFAVLIVSGPRAALRFVAGAALPLALLVFFKLRWAPPNDLLAQVSVADLGRRAPSRIVLVARAFAAQPFDFGKWGLAPGAVLLCWIAGFRRRERTLGTLFALPALGAIFCIYLVTPWDPVAHMRDSLDRLLFQLWPAIIYATALSLPDRAFGSKPAPAA